MKAAWIVLSGFVCTGLLLWWMPSRQDNQGVADTRGAAVNGADWGSSGRTVVEMSERLAALEEESKLMRRLALSRSKQGAGSALVGDDSTVGDDSIVGDGSNPSEEARDSGTIQEKGEEEEATDDGSALAEAQAVAMEVFEQDLQNRVAEEGADRGWTASVQDAFLAKLAQLDAGPAFESARCGRSLCSVIVSHEDDSAHADLVGVMQGSTQEFGGQFLVRRHEDPAGGYKTTFYFSRPGEGIPELDLALSGQYN